MTTPQMPPENWFYTNTRVPDKSGSYSFQFLNKQPRPGNLEDEIVQDFLGETDLGVFLENDIERRLRIALRRAADAAVRTTLDAEGQGVVYETAEERAAGKDAPLPESEIAKAIKLQTVELARIADLFDSICGEHHGFRFVTTGAIEWEE